MKKTYLLIIFLLLACEKKSTEPKLSIHEENLLATLYFQRATECKALQLQAFKLAKLKIDEIIKTKSDKKRALVVDIDETVLDNGPYGAKQIFTKESYPTGWDEWVKLEQAEPITGSLDFLNYAVKNGVDVFYISNRKAHLLEATINNLKKVGFPQVEESHILLRTKSSDKEERRSKVKESHEIVLLMGDNMGDFVSLFDKLPMEERLAKLDAVRNDIVEKFIVLPNPTYGNWESAIYNHNYKLSEVEMIKLRKKALIVY